MKKLLFTLCLFLLASLLSGCENASRLDLSRGYGEHLRLVHLSRGAGEDYQRIVDFHNALQDPQTLEKDISLFSYYPDYLLEIDAADPSLSLSVVIDINGNHVDFYYTGQEETIYRAKVSAEEFLALVHGM